MAGVAGRSGPKQEKQWRDALMLAVKRTDGDTTKLAKIAARVVEDAIAGNLNAAIEIGNRLDGKADANLNVNAGDSFVQALKELNALRTGHLVGEVMDQVGDEPADLRDRAAEGHA